MTSSLQPPRPLRARLQQPEWQAYGYHFARRGLARPLNLMPALPTLDEIQQQRELGQRPPFAQMRTWLAHPDERIVLRTLQLFPDRVCEMPAALEDLFRYATTRADQEGHHWTPLLDRLSQTGLWRDAASLLVSPGREATPEPRLTALEPWIQGEGDVQFLTDAIFTLRDPALMRRLARLSPGLGEEAMHTLVTLHGESESLVENPHLGSLHWRELFQAREAYLSLKQTEEEKILERALRRVLLRLEERSEVQARLILESALQSSPRWLLNFWKKGQLQHPALPSRDLLSLLLTTQDSTVRLELIRHTAPPPPSVRRR